MRGFLVRALLFWPQVKARLRRVQQRMELSGSSSEEDTTIQEKSVGLSTHSNMPGLLS